MKRILLPAGVLALAAAAAFLLTRRETPPAVDPATLHKGTLATGWQPHEVFQQALRRRPASDDKILHAERREWTENTANGISRWQWFLAIEPGPALTNWLNGNPFSVLPATPAAVAKIAGPPSWFPRELEDYDILAGGSTGRLVFLRSRDGKTLYASSSGDGFAPGAPQPSAPSAPASSGGAVAARRLPDSLPPNPSAK